MEHFLINTYLSGVFFVLGGCFVAFCMMRKVPELKYVPVILLAAVLSWLVPLFYIINMIFDWSM